MALTLSSRIPSQQEIIITWAYTPEGDVDADDLRVTITRGPSEVRSGEIPVASNRPISPAKYEDHLRVRKIENAATSIDIQDVAAGRTISLVAAEDAAQLSVGDKILIVDDNTDGRIRTIKTITGGTITFLDAENPITDSGNPAVSDYTRTENARIIVNRHQVTLTADESATGLAVGDLITIVDDNTGATSRTIQAITGRVLTLSGQPLTDAYKRDNNARIIAPLPRRRRWEDTFYKVVIKRVRTGEDDEILESEIHGAMEGVSPYAVQLASICRMRLRQVTGQRWWYYRRKTSGPRCRTCYDTTRKRVTKSNCRACYGTTYEGGYDPRQQLYLGTLPAQEMIQKQIFADIEASATAFWTTNEYDIHIGDLLVEHNNRRWKVTEVNNREYQRTMYRQDLRVDEVSPDDIVFQIPLPA